MSQRKRHNADEGHNYKGAHCVNNRAQVLVVSKRWFRMAIACSQCGQEFGSLSCDGTPNQTFTVNTTYNPSTIAALAQHQKHAEMAKTINGHVCFQ